MGFFRKREKEAIEEITNRVLRKYDSSPAEPLGPGEFSVVDPVLLDKVAKEVKKAKDQAF